MRLIYLDFLAQDLIDFLLSLFGGRKINKTIRRLIAVGAPMYVLIAVAMSNGIGASDIVLLALGFIHLAILVFALYCRRNLKRGISLIRERGTTFKIVRTEYDPVGIVTERDPDMIIPG